MYWLKRLITLIAASSAKLPVSVKRMATAPVIRTDTYGTLRRLHFFSVSGSKPPSASACAQRGVLNEPAIFKPPTEIRVP